MVMALPTRAPPPSPSRAAPASRGTTPPSTPCRGGRRGRGTLTWVSLAPTISAGTPTEPIRPGASSGPRRPSPATCPPATPAGVSPRPVKTSASCRAPPPPPRARPGVAPRRPCDAGARRAHLVSLLLIFQSPFCLFAHSTHEAPQSNRFSLEKLNYYFF